MTGDNAVVEFRGVKKSYDGETFVVKDASFDVKAGEFLTLLGPSGSGKTSCLMMLAGFEAATEGEIILQGRAINDVPPHKRNIGMVFQNYALFPHKTARENVAYPLWVRGMSRSVIERKVADALSKVRLGPFGNRRPGQLSGGEQQRVAIARALVFEPQLVLMDEPLGALDRQLREQMQFEIMQLHRDIGFSVVYVTHDQSEALTMSDRIAVLNHGVVEQLATPSVLYDEPDNAFVAQFVGENNFLSGRVEALTGNSCTVRTATNDLVSATPVNVGPVGSLATLSLRPEAVGVADTHDHDNVFDAAIKEVIFRGDHMRARASLCGNPDFIIKVPKGSASRYPLKAGDSVKLAWRKEDCRTFAAQSQ